MEAIDTCLSVTCCPQHQAIQALSHLRKGNYEKLLQHSKEYEVTVIHSCNTEKFEYSTYDSLS